MSNILNTKSSYISLKDVSNSNFDVILTDGREGVAEVSIVGGCNALVESGVPVDCCFDVGRKGESYASDIVFFIWLMVVYTVVIFGFKKAVDELHCGYLEI